MQVALAACDRIVRRDGLCRSDPVVIRLASAAREGLMARPRGAVLPSAACLDEGRPSEVRPADVLRAEIAVIEVGRVVRPLR